METLLVRLPVGHIQMLNVHSRYWRTSSYRVAVVALCFVCAYHSAAPGSNPKHTIYAFFNLYYWNCIEKITKINKKRPGLAHFLKKTPSVNILIPIGRAGSLLLLPVGHECDRNERQKLRKKKFFSFVLKVIIMRHFREKVNSTFLSFEMSRSLIFGSRSVWPDAEIKSSPRLSKKLFKRSQGSFY